MRHFSILPVILAAFLLIPAPGQAQKRKDTSTPKAEAGPVKFNADDPFDKVNQITKGTPWETDSAKPAEVLEGVTAAIPEPLPDLADISSIQYNMAVTLAFESMRLFYGDMSEADAKNFSDMWAPLYDHPTQEIIDYLNKLIPLLSQFIIARESYIDSAQNIELLMLDASEAMDWEDKEAFNSAMFQIRLYTNTLKELDAAMADLANQIIALGNPPNPLEARAAARRRYNRAFPKEEIYLGETWMGTRIDQDHSISSLGPLTEPMMRYLLKAKVYGEDRYFVIELKESGIPDKDDEWSNLLVEQMRFRDKGVTMPDFKSDGDFQTYYPKPPAMKITMLTMNLMRQFEISYVSDEDRESGIAEKKQEYHDMAGHYGNRLLRSGIFFKTAMLWSMANKWNEYEFKDDGYIPEQALRDFEEAVKKQAVIELANKKGGGLLGGKKKSKDQEQDADQEADQLPSDPDAVRKKQVQDSLAFEERSRQESIQCREEIVRSIEANLQREKEYLSKANERYRKASPAERPAIEREIKDLEMRIIHLSSDIQSERDQINGLKTGSFVHTRSAFDNYAVNKMIYDSKVDAARRDRTKRAADILDKQINRLPENERDDARERAEKLLYEDGALVSGDLEKVQKLGRLFYNQNMANELKIQAEAEDAVAWADLKEAGANAVIMACGSITVGLAGEALAGAYGTAAATTIWGTRAVGAVYGGVTGYISGGPGKAASSAAGFFHPVTGAVASFVEGYTAQGNEGKSVYEKVWEGTKQAGKDYLIGKAFELGGALFAKTASAVLPDGIVHFNLTSNFSSKQKLDMLRTQKQRLEAEDAVKAFSKMNDDYVHQLALGKSPEQLAGMRKEINQVAASLNSDYHAKWYMKYKATPTQRAHFDQAVQANYREMTPKMAESLQAKGYDMSDIEFRQFRNSSSSGSSSMDLDMAPVSKTTGKEPVFFKNGEKTTAAEFMKDAQNSMNTVYREQHGISATASEMNLTTSAHPEAYSTTALLDKNVDYSKLDAKDIASIGKVLNSKVNTIEGNIRMTETTKMQAKSREATKEIENMLIPKLKQELKNSTNVKDAERIAGDIEFWTDMNTKLSQIGKETSNPMEIHKLNEEIRRATGGKDATQVVNDLIKAFDPSFKL